MSFMSKIKSAVTSNTAKNIEVAGIVGAMTYIAFSEFIDPKNSEGVQTAFTIGVAAGVVGTIASNKLAGTNGDVGWNAMRTGVAAAMAYRASKFINPEVAVTMIEITSDAGEIIGDVVSDTAGVIA